MPSAAAARSLVRTAISRRPLRPRRTLATTVDRQHRHDQHEDPVAGRVVDRPDVVAEQVGVPDLGALDTAGVVAVLEQHQLDRGSQPEGDDRQVDTSSAHRRQTEDHTEGHGGGDAGEQSEQERDVEHRDQPPCDVGAEAGNRVLGEGELSGVPGQHDDRQEDDRHPQRHGDGVDPLRLLRHHHEDDGAAAEQRPGPRDSTVAKHRLLLQVVVTQWQRPPPNDEDHDDDQERQRCSKALLIGEPSDQRLADAEGEPGDRGDGKRPEVADQRRRHRGQDQRRHRRDLQGDDRNHEDPGDGGDRRPQRPVQQRDPVGRQPDRCCRALALRHRLGGEAELARSIEHPQTERRRAPDADQDEAIDGDPDVSPQRDAIRRQPALDLTSVGAVADHDRRLDRDQHTERGDHADQRAGPSQRSHDHPVGERPEEARPGNAHDRRRQERPAVLLVQLPLHEDAGDGRCAERKVQDPGAAVDHDQALGGKGVQRADAQTQQRESDDLVHRPLSPLPTLRREASEGRRARMVPRRASRTPNPTLRGATSECRAI